MKIFYGLSLLILLTSCTTTTENNVTPNETNLPETVIEDTTTDEVLNDMSGATDELNETVENEVISLEAPYKNPQADVDMVVSYSLDAEGNIETMHLSATTWDISKYDESVQALVWQPIDAAESFYISGASLATDAFNAAIKNR